MVFALVQIAVVLTVFGLIWWLVTTYLPIPQPVKMVLSIVFVLIACVMLLHLVGLVDLDHAHVWRWN